MNGQAIPEKFQCALTKQLMKDPIVTAYGHNFEKEVIVNWFNLGNRMCPLTGKPLKSSQVISDRGLKEQIRLWLEVQQAEEEEEKQEIGVYEYESPNYRGEQHPRRPMSTRRPSNDRDDIDVFMISPAPQKMSQSFRLPKEQKKKGLKSMLKNVMRPSLSNNSLTGLR